MNDDNDVTPGTILSRIQNAAGLFASGNKMKYQAIAELYAVYLEAKANPAVAAEIEALYSAQGHPKTDLLTNMVLRIGFVDGTARQRISDMHLLLLECEKQAKQPSDLVGWFIAEGGWRKVLSHAAQTSSITKKTTGSGKRGGLSDHGQPNGGASSRLFKALQSLQEEAKHRTSSNAPPVAIACETGEFLIQVCRKVGAGKFESYWAKSTYAGLEPISLKALSSANSPVA